MKWFLILLLFLIACTPKVENTTYCAPEQREADVCIASYQPVCGWFNENIKCIKYPCADTYSNSCGACKDEKVEYYTEGECPNAS